MLIEQYPLVNDNRTQRQQLRAPQAFHWHLGAPLKDVLEQALERFNGLGAPLMEDASHLYPVIVVGIRPAPGRHQHPIGLLAAVPALSGIVCGIPQDVAHLRWQGRQQLGRDFIIRGIGGGQFRGQRDPDRPPPPRPKQVSAVPPTPPAPPPPPPLRIKRPIGKPPRLPVLLLSEPPP